MTKAKTPAVDSPDGNPVGDAPAEGEKVVDVPADIVDARPRDRVASFSRNSAGEIVGNDPVLIGDKDAAIEANKEQLRQQAGSNLRDLAERTDSVVTNDQVQAVQDKAEAQAEAEVEERHESNES